MSSPRAVPVAHAPRRWLAGMLSVFALIGVIVQWSVRLDYGPDEPYHMEYIYVLGTRLRLPDRSETHIAQHPPLPYLLYALPWRLIGGEQRPLSIPPGPKALSQMSPRSIVARRVLRLVSLLVCLLTLLAIARLAVVLEVPPAWQPVLVFLVAACPMFQYLSGVVNNEGASIFFSTVVCLALVTRVRAGDCTLRQALVIGLLIGLCPWVKQTTLLAVPVAAWTLWTVGDPRQRWARLGAATAVAVPVGIGWPLHNYLVAGDPFPNFLTPANQPQVLHIVRADPAILFGWTRQILETSVLPDWAWMFLPSSVSPAIAAIAAGEVAAAVAVFIFGLRDKGDPQGRQIRAMALTALLVLLIGILQYCLFKDWRAQIGGRYLLNGAPWFVALIGSGLATLARRRSGAPRLSPFALLAAAAIVLCDLVWWYLTSLGYGGRLLT